MSELARRSPSPLSASELYSQKNGPLLYDYALDCSPAAASPSALMYCMIHPT
jgi:hypothetical protein